MNSDKICPKCGLPYIDKSYFGEADHTGIIGCVNHIYGYNYHPGGIVSLKCTERCFLTTEEWAKLEQTEGRKHFIQGKVYLLIDADNREHIEVGDEYTDQLYNTLHNLAGKEVFITVQEKVPKHPELSLISGGN